MALRDLLNLQDAVVIVREGTPANDGMGGLATTATTTTTLSRAAIWQGGGSDNLTSGKITKDSTHILALESSAYTFTDHDVSATFNGDTYRITGRADEVMNRSELTVVGLELLT